MDDLGLVAVRRSSCSQRPLIGVRGSAPVWRLANQVTLCDGHEVFFVAARARSGWPPNRRDRSRMASGSAIRELRQTLADTRKPHAGPGRRGHGAFGGLARTLRRPRRGGTTRPRRGGRGRRSRGCRRRWRRRGTKGRRSGSSTARIWFGSDSHWRLFWDSRISDARWG